MAAKFEILSLYREYVIPAKKEENMLFEDAGYTYVMKKLK